jgi:hypothetical protein
MTEHGPASAPLDLRELLATLGRHGVDYTAIAMKRATGRPADDRDVAALTALSD